MGREHAMFDGNGKRLAVPAVQRLPLLGRRGFDERGPPSLARIRVESELAHGQHLSAHVDHGAVHAALVIGEHPQTLGLRRKPVGVLGRRVPAHADQDEQAEADLSDDLVLDGDSCPGDALEQDLHGVLAS